MFSQNFVGNHSGNLFHRRDGMAAGTVIGIILLPANTTNYNFLCEKTRLGDYALAIVALILKFDALGHFTSPAPL